MDSIAVFRPTAIGFVPVVVAPWLKEVRTVGGARPPVAATTPPPAAGSVSFGNAQILAIAARGDRAAFAALFAHFAPRVKAYMVRLGANPQVAEELAQETLLLVWRKAAQFDPARAESATWIFTIARNLRIDFLRRDRRPELDPADPVWESAAPPAPDERLYASRRAQAIRRALEALPAEQAQVVRLSFFEDKPHSEIERDLGIPLGTVKSRLRLAMGRLRSALGEPE